MSSSTNLYPNIPFFKGNHVIARRNHVKVAAAALTTSPLTDSTYQSKILLQLKNPSKDPLLFHSGFDQLAFLPTGSILDSISVNASKKKDVEHELAVVREGRELVKRLETIVERMRVSEMEKLITRTKGELSIEEKQVVEMMSAEIVNKFLEKPIEYLRCGDGNLEIRIKDLNVFVGMLESSCLKDEKMRSKGCLKNSHP